MQEIVFYAARRARCLCCSLWGSPLEGVHTKDGNFCFTTGVRSASRGMNSRYILFKGNKRVVCFVA